MNSIMIIYDGNTDDIYYTIYLVNSSLLHRIRTMGCVLPAQNKFVSNYNNNESTNTSNNTQPTSPAPRIPLLTFKS